MNPLRILRVSTLLVTFVFLLFYPRASAQITMLQTYQGKTIWCSRSGLRGIGDSCGAEHFEDVFVGIVVSVQEVSENELRLTLRPEEVFRGKLPGDVSVVTSQGHCLDEIHPGDHWLFSLQRDGETKQLLLGYGSPSGPVAQAKDMIDRLRRLVRMTGEGLVIGDVSAPSRKAKNYLYIPSGNAPSSNHTVVMRRISDGVEYKAVTDHSGHFEFSPLPVGDYDLIANSEPNLWSGDGGPTTVQAQECRDYHIDLKPDGSISGFVMLPHGENRGRWIVRAFSLEEEVKSDASTDGSGHFELRGLSPGRYLVVVDGAASWPAVKFDVYAPGVSNRDKAFVVELGKGQKQEGIDIQIPAEAIP